MTFTNSFINCEYIETYIIINETLVFEICKRLQIEPYFLFKSKSLRKYNDQLFKRFITHYLLLTLNVHDHKKELYFILIIQLR